MLKRSSITLALFLILAAGLVLAVGGVQAAPAGTIRYVAPGGNCGGASPCYATIQAAVDAANVGDVIKVAGDTYGDVHHIPRLDTALYTATQVVAIDKAITLKGGFTTSDWIHPDPKTHPTILDAHGSGRAMLIAGNINPVIEGFTLTRGDAKGLGGYPAVVGPPIDAGGGLYVITATVTLRNNRIVDNKAPWSGGGAYLYQSRSILENNTIGSNSSGQVGGGVLLKDSDAILQGNTIISNTSSSMGGGIYLQSCTAARVVANRIQGNTSYEGAGLDFYLCEGSIEKNLVMGNRASDDGGGMYLYHSPVILAGNVIQGNYAGGKGGGLYLSGASASLVNNVVVGNETEDKGAGVMVMWTKEPMSMKHTTIANNRGGDGSGIHLAGVTNRESTVYMTNTIISGQAVGVVVDTGSKAVLDATLWHGNTTDRSGPGVIQHARDVSGDPRFASDGYHLMQGSAAIDKGVNAGVLLDVDGEMRPAGVGFDLGADEFGSSQPRRIFLPLLRRKR